MIFEEDMIYAMLMLVGNVAYSRQTNTMTVLL